MRRRRRPSFGLRFATKLPNASNESGIGLDTTDFFASFLIAKTVQSVRIVGNVGLGILGDPTRGDQQNDVLTYGLSFARALTQQAEVVGEINGRVSTRSGEPPPGTESRGIARFGARYTIGSWRADAAVLFGVTSSDPSVRLRRRLHLRLQRVPDSVMPAVRVVKAHAYGNDFVCAPATDAERRPAVAGARDLPSSSRHRRRRAAAVHPARSRRLDEARSTRTAAGRSCRATACDAWRRSSPASQDLQPGATVTVDTDAGVKPLELLARDGERYTFRAAMGQPANLRQATIAVARRVGHRLGARSRQPAVRRAGSAARRRSLQSTRPGARHASDVSGRHQRRVRSRSRRRIASGF